MSSYVIITDGAMDLLPEDHSYPYYKVIPMNIQIGEEILPIYGQESLSFHQDFYQRINNGDLPTTSMIPLYIYEEEFDSCLSEGKDVLYISMSGGITGTYEQSLLAKNEVLKKYPDRQIQCLDSLSASHGGGMLIHRAIKNQSKGMTLQENMQDLESCKRSIFSIGLAMNLRHLHRGGRVSAGSAFFGTALNIKPILYFDKEGKLLPLLKARGLKQSFKEIVRVQNQYGDPDNDWAFISHCNNERDAIKLRDLLLSETQLERVDVNLMTPIIGTHLGPDSLIFSSIGQRP